jgi:hypothetical protein
MNHVKYVKEVVGIVKEQDIFIKMSIVKFK